MSPLDKDVLKRKCLERVRSERRRQISRNRRRQGSPGHKLISTATLELSPVPSDEDRSPLALSTARQILRHGLHDMSLDSRTRTSSNGHRGQLGQQESVTCRQFNALGVPISTPHQPPPSLLMEINEENAYREAVGGSDGGSRQNVVHGRNADLGFGVGEGRGSEEEHVRALGVEGREPMAMEGEDGYAGDDDGEMDKEEEHLLSPGEYDEMMRYIEEACREEDLKAEAEVCRNVGCVCWASKHYT